MRRFGLIFLLICAVFMLCSCESNDDDPTDGPDIFVQFGYTLESGQNNYWATVTALTAESWNPSMALSVDGTPLSTIGSATHILADGKYTNTWKFSSEAYEPGVGYAVTLTVDGSPTSVNVTINPIAVITPGFPNPYNPNQDVTLNWSIDLPAGSHPFGQAIIGNYAAGHSFYTLELYPEPEDRSFVIEGGQLETGASGLLALEVLTNYATTPSNSKVTFAYFTTSVPTRVTIESTIVAPAQLPPPVDYRKIIEKMRR